jgi:hypothetical protein
MIQLTLTTTVKVTRQTPSAMKNAIDFVRLEMRMGAVAQIIVAKRFGNQKGSFICRLHPTTNRWAEQA